MVCTSSAIRWNARRFSISISRFSTCIFPVMCSKLLRSASLVVSKSRISVLQEYSQRSIDCYKSNSRLTLLARVPTFFICLLFCQGKSVICSLDCLFKRANLQCPAFQFGTQIVVFRQQSLNNSYHIFHFSSEEVKSSNGVEISF